jgi:hypothetical protein
MAETLVEEKIAEEKGVDDSPKARLEKLLRENNIKVFTAKDFDFPKDKKMQAKIQAEVDEFLQMREEWREDDRKLSLEREKSWR